MVIGKANPSQSPGRIVRAGVAAALGVTLLAGCAAGQRAQTSVERAVIDGVNAHTTNISVNNLSVSAPPNGSSYAAGDNAPLQLVLVNTGAMVMQLNSVTVDTSVAASATVSPSLLPDAGVSSAASDSSSPAGPLGSTPADSASAAPVVSGSGDSAAATSSAGDTPTASAPSSVPISVPVGSSVRVGLAGSSASIVLNDLAKPLYPAQNITVVFNFSDGESLSVLTNVHLGASGAPAPTLPVSVDEG